MKKVKKTTRPFRYEINQILYDYTVEVRNRLKGLELIELWTELSDELWTVLQETGIKTIPMEKKCKTAKWLSGEALQIAVKRREAIMASGPITSWEIDGETVETVSDFILGGYKITADGDCSHEIKRHLLLGRKVMTNLDSILKSRDIALLTKVHLVKAMVFPVVMDVRVGL